MILCTVILNEFKKYNLWVISIHVLSVCMGFILNKHDFHCWNRVLFFINFIGSDSLTGFTIHFCLGPPSSHARFSSFRSDGRTKVCGKNPNSFFPFWTWSLERFLHSRSFLPIWKDPGKWLSWKEKIFAH